MIQLVHHHLYHHHHHYLLNHSVRPHMFGWSLVLPCMQRGHSFDLRIESSVKSLCKGNSAVEQSDARPVSLLSPHSSNPLSLPPRSKDQIESCSQCLPCCSHARFPMSVNRGSPPVSPAHSPRLLLRSISLLGTWKSKQRIPLVPGSCSSQWAEF